MKKNEAFNATGLAGRTAAILGSDYIFDKNSVVETPTPWSFTFPAVYKGVKVYVRVGNMHSSDLGSLRNELVVARKLANLAIAPEVLFQDVENGIYVTKAVEQGTPCLTGIAESLRILHACDLCTEATQAEIRLSNCINSLADFIHIDKRFKRFSLAHNILIARALPASPTLAFCHNDLNPTNVLFDGNRALFIDFDFCGLGDPTLDVATVSLWVCKTDLEVTQFLTLYDRVPPSPERLRSLHYFRRYSLARYACMTLWLASGTQFPEDVQWDEQELVPFQFDTAMKNKELAVLKLAHSFAYAVEKYQLPM